MKGTIEIAGHHCTVSVSTTTGIFTIEDGSGIGIGHSETLEAAKQQARRELAKRKVRVSVPFRTLEGHSAVATGIHAGTGHVIATVSSPIGTTGRTRERTVQLDRNYREDVFKSDTPDAVFAEIETLQAEMRERRERLAILADEWQISLHETVGLAIETAARESVAGT